MEKIRIIRRGECCGEATLCSRGDRMEIRMEMDDPGDGLYRAVLRGERGQLALGVLEQAAGRLSLCRRPWRRDVDALGRLAVVETVCSFPFRKKCGWEKVRQPANRFRTPMIRDRLANIEEAWIRREGEHRFLALELVDGRPFPLEMLFCLGKVRSVEGRRCVVYRFDRDEMPLGEDSTEKI